MEKISTIKKVYTIFNDEETRGFIASMKRLQKDCEDAQKGKAAEAAEAAVKCAADAVSAARKQDAKAEARKQLDAAKKAAAEAKKAAEAVQQRGPKAIAALEALAEVMQRKGLKPEDICKDYLLQHLPKRFNAAQHICSVSIVAIADEAEARKQYANSADMLIERDEAEAGKRLYIYKPINLFTANSFLNLFTAAADAKQKAEAEARKAESAIEKEAKKAEAAKKRAAYYEALRKKLADYDAESAAAQK